MNSTFRSALMSGVALAAIAVAAPESANAQMYTTGPGFYLSVEGRYIFNGSDKIRDLPVNSFTIPFGPVSTVDALKEKAGHGWGGKAMLGYRFTNNWDVGVGFSGGWHKKGKGDDSYALTTTFPINERINVLVTGTAEQELKVKLDYYIGDFEAGYNWKMGNSNIRLFGGLRYANFTQKATGSVSLSGGVATFTTITSLDPVGTGTAAAEVRRKTTYWGIGPRIGVNGQFGLGAGGFHIFGGVSGAILYGKYKDERRLQAAVFVGSPPLGTITSTSIKVKDKSKKKWVPNVEGELGLGYTFGAGSGTTVSLQAGYRADAYFGAGSKADVYAIEAVGLGPDSKKDDYLFHGPFVRLTATFGPAAMAAVAAPPPAPPPAPKKNYLVFFDFDRSNITADAQRVIEEAATAAKAGNVARIQLTGHTDRSGSDAYNLALGTRRGDAVKQALIRLGIPAASIAVISRGESQPLVPTADGVREPQNRRVEIML
jgi:outer membrane protein OmpA-like peptidoglycan-associated protein